MTNIVKLTRDGDSYVAEYEWTTFRFLLSDGRTIDVKATQDDSWLRDEVLKIANNKKTITDKTKFEITICGVATTKKERQT